MPQIESQIGNDALNLLCEIAEETPRGAFVEVGVYKGGSAYFLAGVAREQNRKIYLYDTFSGIPHADPLSGDSHVVGDFNDTSVETVRDLIPDAIVLPGVFPGTMIEMGPVAFAHIDADQYKSIRDSIDSLWPSIVDGGAMLFDDYGCLSGATKAVNEKFCDVFLTKHNKAVVVKGIHVAN